MLPSRALFAFSIPPRARPWKPPRPSRRSTLSRSPHGTHALGATLRRCWSCCAAAPTPTRLTAPAAPRCTFAVRRAGRAVPRPAPALLTHPPPAAATGAARCAAYLLAFGADTRKADLVRACLFACAPPLADRARQRRAGVPLDASSHCTVPPAPAGCAQLACCAPTHAAHDARCRAVAALLLHAEPDRHDALLHRPDHEGHSALDLVSLAAADSAGRAAHFQCGAVRDFHVLTLGRCDNQLGYAVSSRNEVQRHPRRVEGVHAARGMAVAAARCARFRPAPAPPASRPLPPASTRWSRPTTAT